MSVPEILEIKNTISEAIKFYNKPLYKVSEVAEILGVNAGKVNELIKAGLLVGLQLGCMKVTKKEIDRFLETYAGKDVNKILSDREVKNIEKAS